MGNGRGLALKPSQLTSEQTFVADSAEAGRLGELRWIDKKLLAKELYDIQKRIEELERERKLVEESLKKIAQSNLPKASSDFYYVKRNVERSIQKAQRLWLTLAGAQAVGALAAVLASGTGVLIAGAAGTLGIVGGLLGSRSLNSEINAEMERADKGVRLVEVRERLKDELSLFEKEGRKLQRRREELLRVCGVKEIPIKEHIERIRAIIHNLQLMNEAQFQFIKRRKARPIPQGRLREIHDSAQELAYLSSPTEEPNLSLLVRNIAREMSTDLILRAEGVTDLSELTNSSLDRIGKTAIFFEKQLSDLKYVPPIYFE